MQRFDEALIDERDIDNDNEKGNYNEMLNGQPSEGCFDQLGSFVPVRPAPAQNLHEKRRLKSQLQQPGSAAKAT